jgi:hypothetical protein
MMTISNQSDDFQRDFFTEVGSYLGYYERDSLRQACKTSRQAYKRLQRHYKPKKEEKVITTEITKVVKVKQSKDEKNKDVKQIINRLPIKHSCVVEDDRYVIDALINPHRQDQNCCGYIPSIRVCGNYVYLIDKQNYEWISRIMSEVPELIHLTPCYHDGQLDAYIPSVVIKLRRPMTIEQFHRLVKSKANDDKDIVYPPEECYGLATSFKAITDDNNFNNYVPQMLGGNMTGVKYLLKSKTGVSMTGKQSSIQYWHNQFVGMGSSRLNGSSQEVDFVIEDTDDMYIITKQQRKTFKDNWSSVYIRMNKHTFKPLEVKGNLNILNVEEVDAILMKTIKGRSKLSSRERKIDAFKAQYKDIIQEDVEIIQE